MRIRLLVVTLLAAVAAVVVAPDAARAVHLPDLQG
jgi:hypothetical protein